MMTRFIAMPISTNTSLYIMCTWNIIRQFYSEQFIQSVTEPIFTSFIHITLYILRNVPRILNSKAFRYISPSMHRTGTLISHRSEWCTPVSLTVPTTHIFRFRINQGLIRKRTIQEITIIIFLTQSLGSLRNAIIIISIFQCFRHRFRFFIERDISHGTILRQTVIIRIHRCGLHGFVRTFVIKAFHSFHNHVCQYGNSMITNHTPGFISIERPDGKHFLHTLVIMCQH